ncbi:hypothetical protein OAG63_00175 [Methylacidiphilales bacterium]|nr:hypothetical protein [Candidatus Methylacidiphilales bacterium]
MRILLDECVHIGLKKAFPNHSVKTVPEAGWSGIKNGKLLGLIASHFDVFLTIDQNIRYQQNLTELPFAILFVAVPNNMMESYRPFFGLMQKTVEELRPGEIKVIP